MEAVLKNSLRKRFSAWKTWSSIQTTLTLHSHRVANEKRIILEEHWTSVKTINEELSTLKDVVSEASKEKDVLIGEAQSLKTQLQHLSEECSLMRTERSKVVTGLKEKCVGLEVEVGTLSESLNDNLRSTNTLELECKILRKSMLDKDEKIDSMGQLLYRSQELMKFCIVFAKK